jgi:hypothetical protein
MSITLSVLIVKKGILHHNLYNLELYPLN